MKIAVNKLREFRRLIGALDERAASKRARESSYSKKIKKVFSEHMDNDLNLKQAFDEMHKIVSGISRNSLQATDAAGIMKALRKIDEVLQVFF